MQSELLRFCNIYRVDLNSFQTLITEFYPATWLYLCKKDFTETGWLNWLNRLIKILKEPKKAQYIFKHTRNFRDFSMQQKLIAIVKNNKITLDYDTLKAEADFDLEYFYSVSELLDVKINCY